MVSRSPDVMSILEAAYAGGSDADEWIRNVLTVASPWLDGGLGVAAFRFAHTHTGVCTGGPLASEHAPGLAGATSELLGVFSGLPDESAFLNHLYPRAPVVCSLSQLSRFHEARVERRPLMGVDAVAVVAGNPSGRGCVVFAPRRSRAALPRSAKALWARVAAHLAAGYRLVLQRDARVDAVLNPNGRLEHLESSEVTGAEGKSLSDAVRAIDHARGSLRRADPECSLRLWRGLVAGRWTLVDHVDHDGRRYVFAKHNAPDARPWHTLTKDETAVVVYSAHGHSYKTIAYELGVSEASVGQRLGKAARKVGVRSRLELVAAYRRENSHPKPAVR